MNWWIAALVVLALITAGFFVSELYLAAVFSGWCGGVVADRIYQR